MEIKKYLLYILIVLSMSIVPNIVHATDAYNYMSSIIRSLESCEIGISYLKSNNSKEDKTGVFLMKGIIENTHHINTAISLLEPYLLSKDNTTKKSAEQFTETYKGIIQTNEGLLDFIEKIHNNKEDVYNREGTYNRELSERVAAMDGMWKLIPYAVAISGHALVDNERTEDGFLKFLKITSEEAESLKVMLVNIFGEGVKNKTKGGHTVFVSANMLYEFLCQGWKYADTK